MGMMPANTKASKRDDINYVAGFSGLMTATPSDASADDMVPGDLATAKAFGARIAQAAALLK
jgi:NAD(P)H dehydrogenase (quinone)